MPLRCGRLPPGFGSLRGMPMVGGRPWSLPFFENMHLMSLSHSMKNNVYNYIKLYKQNKVPLMFCNRPWRKVLVSGSWKIESVDILKVGTPLWRTCCTPLFLGSIERQHLARLFPFIQDSLKIWYVAKNMKRTWNLEMQQQIDSNDQDWEKMRKVKKAANASPLKILLHGTYCYCQSLSENPDPFHVYF